MTRKIHPRSKRYAQSTLPFPSDEVGLLPATKIVATVRELEASVDLDILRARLRVMDDAELVKLGKEMANLVYPLTYGSDGKPSVSAFSIQFGEWTVHSVPGVKSFTFPDAVSSR